MPADAVYEIEAEVNLVFDQFLYLIADELYSYCKNRASAAAELDDARWLREGASAVGRPGRRPRAAATRRSRSGTSTCSGGAST